MLDHVSITVSNLAMAEPFYDAVFAALGVPKVASDHANGWIGYGERCDSGHPDRIYLSIRLGPPLDDAPRRHWCFKAPTRAVVDAFWTAGLLHGGSDNGPPGLREKYHPCYYAAFLIDPAGNHIEAVCHRAEQG
ncbi:VOC family protein [Gluconacetobacter asukensis]|uniref:VOC family protein n=1 Tax=Gluconacetobacter asukensis TaxID=1017181 RepID=A0A7W4P394_9PROT|nr:VOC family protein [Gluconacetobacter asukensis]MBB2172545.1 VOC family protein [Gluconacetobacter asukensis]